MNLPRAMQIPHIDHDNTAGCHTSITTSDSAGSFGRVESICASRISAPYSSPLFLPYSGRSPLFRRSLATAAEISFTIDSTELGLNVSLVPVQTRFSSCTE